jgi:hypothetical protein
LDKSHETGGKSREQRVVSQFDCGDRDNCSDASITA